MLKVAANVESAINRLVKKYNKVHGDTPLPKVTPHTFCTNMANQGMNPKALQYIMGHANITMALNYYTHADGNSAKAEMERIERNHMETQPVEQPESKDKAA